MTKRLGPILCLLVSFTFVSSCSSRWRPPPYVPAMQTDPVTLELASYLRGSPIGRWVYERRELTSGSARATDTYVRRIFSNRMTEGLLEQRPFPPVSHYIGQPEDRAASPATQPAARGRAAAPLRGGLGLLFELEEPLPPIPTELSETEPHTASTTIRYFDHHGKLDSEGTISRVAEIEGIEDVETPAGLFENCLRVRVDLTFRFGRAHVVEWTSYMWLSPELGEVRRIQRMWGRVWVLWFSSAHEYKLVSFEPEEASLTAFRTEGSPGDSAGGAGPGWMHPGLGPTGAWSQGAILLDQSFPHPRIGGMVVDFAPSTFSE
jgi:hypothetical protein